MFINSGINIYNRLSMQMPLYNKGDYMQQQTE